jgi:hypothetical protein
MSKRKERETELITQLLETRFEVRRLREEGELRRRRIVELQRKVDETQNKLNDVSARLDRVSKRFAEVEALRAKND